MPHLAPVPWAAPIKMAKTPAPTPAVSSSAIHANRLSEAEWAEAKALFELGRMTKTELAAKYGVSRQGMTMGLDARGAVYGSKSKEIEEATVEGQKTDARKRAEEITVMKARRVKSIDLLDKLQNKIISEVLTGSKPLESKNAEFRTLNVIIKNTALIRQELWDIYDLNRDPDGGEDIPEFIVSEYTPDEIAALNNERLGVSPEEALKRLEMAAQGIDGPADPSDDLGIENLLAGV